MPFEFGTVALVPFPYTDQSGVKRRPAVVVNSPLYAAMRPDLVVFAITSRVPAVLSPLEVGLADWRSAGLARPSVVKPVALTVERSVVMQRLGRYSARDCAQIAGMVGACLTTQYVAVGA